MTDAFEKLSAKQCLQTVPFGVLVMSQDKKIIWVNEQLASMLHLSVSEICALKASVIEEAHLQAVFSQARLVNVPAQDETGERVLSCHSTQADGLTISFYEDVTDTMELKARLETLSINDSVTGVLNKRGLFRDLEPLVSRSRRYGNVLSLFILLTNLSSDLSMYIFLTF